MLLASFSRGGAIGPHLDRLLVRAGPGSSTLRLVLTRDSLGAARIILPKYAPSQLRLLKLRTNLTIDRGSDKSRPFVDPLPDPRDTHLSGLDPEKDGAGGGSRTHTGCEALRIFIPLRLSPPPSGVRGPDYPFAVTPVCRRFQALPV